MRKRRRSSYLVNIQEKLENLESMKGKDASTNLHFKLKALTASYNNSVEDRRNINHDLHKGNIWSYSVTAGLVVMSIIVMLATFIARMTYRRQKYTFKDLDRRQKNTFDDLVENGFGNITINTKTSDFVDDFVKLDMPTKAVFRMVMELPQDKRGDRLLQIMQELAKRDGVTINTKNIDEISLKYFTKYELEKVAECVNSSSSANTAKAKA